MILIILLISLVYNSNRTYSLTFKDGTKSYKYDRIYNMFDIGFVIYCQEDGEGNVFNLNEFDSSIYEILKNAVDEDNDLNGISVKDFFSCCKMLSEFDWDESELEHREVYKKICDAIQAEKKEYFKNTEFFVTSAKLVLFKPGNIEHEHGNIFYIIEPIENIFESSNVKNYDQLSAFLKIHCVQELRINYEFLTEELVEKISKTTNITKLMVMANPDTKLVLPDNFIKINYIQSLVLELSCDMKNLVPVITKFKDLRHFKFHTESIDNEDLKILINNENLRYFEIICLDLLQGNLYEISNSKTLEVLHLSGDGDLEMLEGVKEMHNIKKLKLGIFDLTPDMYKIFSFFPNLEVLDVEGMDLFEDFGKSIQRLTKLTELNVNDTGIDVENFNQITEITSLTKLYINNSGVEKCEWGNISKLTNLEELDFENAEQWASDRVAIRKLPNLPRDEKYFKYYSRGTIYKSFTEDDDDFVREISNMVSEADCKPGESFTIEISFRLGVETISSYFEECDENTYSEIYDMVKDVYRKGEESFSVEIIFED